MDCVFEHNDDDKWECVRCHARYSYLPVRQCDADPEKPKPPPPDPASSSVESTVPAARGPGDYLHNAILRWVGESPTEDCQCRSRIAQMNAWGPQGCREHLDEIVGWLLDEAQRRGWRTAKLPGARWAVKRLVLGAIRQADKGEHDSRRHPNISADVVSGGR